MSRRVIDCDESDCNQKLMLFLELICQFLICLLFFFFIILSLFVDINCNELYHSIMRICENVIMLTAIIWNVMDRWLLVVVDIWIFLLFKQMYIVTTRRSWFKLRSYTIARSQSHQWDGCSEVVYSWILETKVPVAVWKVKPLIKQLESDSKLVSFDDDVSNFHSSVVLGPNG